MVFTDSWEYPKFGEGRMKDAGISKAMMSFPVHIHFN